MSDQHSTPHPDDQVVCAVLDGEASASEIAHVEGCAACSARLATFRSLATAVGTPVDPVDAATRAAAIRTAMDPPASLTHWWRKPAPLVLGAAAAIIAVVLAVSALSERGPQSTPTALKESSTRAAGAADSAATLDATIAPLDLGALDETSLRTAIEAQLTNQKSAPSPPAGMTPPGAGSSAYAAPNCESAVRASTPGLPPVTLLATATWHGEPAGVLVFGESTSVRVYVTAAADCRVLHSAQFPPGS